ncbi:MAG: ATP-dependent helicase [Lachnospiraceae bacterium]|nr:ATP-dependent helicase [Lachnospiraceae bacterium]
MESKEQLQAISHKDGPMLVLAGPGSGKTYVLTRHIRHLITAHSIPPDQILVITFTKAAALEMRQRFFSLMEGSGFPVCFATFHAFFYQLLRQQFGYQQFGIMSGKERLHFFKQNLRGVKGLTDRGIDSEVNLYLNTLKRKGKGDDFQVIPNELFSKLISEYRRYCHRVSKLDFDDMANLLYYQLSGKEDILEQIRRKYRYILIDEYQDINQSQYRVIRLLAKPRNNLFVVGDDDQAIYAFRGSDPGIMLAFEKDYPECRKVCLPTNFRSDKSIVRMSGIVIKENEKRFHKEITAFSKEEGEVVFSPFPSKAEEDAGLLVRLKEMEKAGTLGETAVILRNNAQMEALAGKLIKAGIPFLKKEKVRSFFDHPDVIPVLAILRFAEISPKREDFVRFMNAPARGISREALPDLLVSEEKLCAYYADRTETLERIRRLFRNLRFLKGMQPFIAIQYIRQALQYEKHLELCAKRDGTDFEERRKVLEELKERAREFGSIQEMLLYVSEYEGQLSAPNSMTGEEGGVSLYTMHGSKGLEFGTVILPEIIDSLIPGSQILGQLQIEEERRLFYVAMTRAKHKLIISYVDNPRSGTLPSCFLDKLLKMTRGQQLCEVR